MTAAEKYIQMNHCFIMLRDAIFACDVEEAEEPKDCEKMVMQALGVLNNYLDFYKENNGIQTRQKS